MIQAAAPRAAAMASMRVTAVPMDPAAAYEAPISASGSMAQPVAVRRAAAR